MNKVILMGNLGQEPELRDVNGTACLNMRLATSEKWKDKDTQELKEKTEWHSLVMWGARAAALSKHLSKGTKLLIEGELQTRKWQDRETGKDRYATEINVRNVEFAGSKDGGGGNRPPPAEAPPEGRKGWDDDDGDPPFNR